MGSLRFIYRIWRRLSFALLALVLLVVEAYAEHDLALPQTQFGLIGYSENGRYLAYETFGLFGKDGLGQAAVYVLDVIERRWVIGSPVIVEATTPDHLIATLRAEAKQRAGHLIDELHITRPAVLAAMTGDGEPPAEAHSMSFGIPPADGEQFSAPFTLQIAAFDVQAAAPCENLMKGSPRGFSLNIKSFGQNSAIYEDGPLPRSRGCPDDYSLMAVVVPYQAMDMTHAVALVSVRNIGPQGVQRSFVPVPLGTPGRGLN